MLYQIDLVIQAAVEDGKMPDMFKGCIPVEVIKAAKSLIPEIYAPTQDDFKSEVAKSLLKLRTTFKLISKPLGDSPFKADFLIDNFDKGKKKLVVLVHANSINPGSKTPNGFERYKIQALKREKMTEFGKPLGVQEVLETEWKSMNPLQRLTLLYPATVKTPVK